MQYPKQIKGDIFADIMGNIQFLTASQQKFLQEVLSRHEKVSAVYRKKLLKKSFGAWVGRKDIKDGIEYVDKMREGWGPRLERVKV